MKILVVEDDPFKIELVGDFLKEKNMEMVLWLSINPALRYILENKNEISGIILDLGLKSEDDSKDYDNEKGLVLVKELTRKKVDIPILINSTTFIDLPYVMKNHPNVKGQTSLMDHGYTRLERFIANLQEKEQ